MKSPGANTEAGICLPGEQSWELWKHGSSGWQLAHTAPAGPEGGSDEKPVGRVWIGVETPDGAEVRKLDYPGGREEVRRRATVATLALLWRQLRREGDPS